MSLEIDTLYRIKELLAEVNRLRAQLATAKKAMSSVNDHNTFEFLRIIRAALKELEADK